MTSLNSGSVIDYGKFAARLRARKDRWSLLKEVLDEWSVVVQRDEPEEEFSAEAVAEAEARLGFALPTALKEWYALPFRCHMDWPMGDTRADTNLPDPPVYNGMELGDLEVPPVHGHLTWIPQNSSLSEWVLH